MKTGDFYHGILYMGKIAKIEMTCQEKKEIKKQPQHNTCGSKGNQEDKRSKCTWTDVRLKENIKAL